MRSYPSPGDALPRMFRNLVDEIKRLKTRNSQLSLQIEDLEARVTALEEE